MARYIGPKHKKSRRYGRPLLGPCKSLQRKNYPPGQHGANSRRRPSEYARQLAEKQKAKYTYGVLEKQFRNYAKAATKSHGVTGEVLLQKLEMRLDNTIYRMSLAPTRRAARQIVSHKHIQINGKTVNIPSYSLKPGDIIHIRDRAKKHPVISASLEGYQRQYTWLEWDPKQMQGKVIAVPTREQIPEELDEQMIIELCAR